MEKTATSMLMTKPLLLQVAQLIQHYQEHQFTPALSNLEANMQL